MASPTKVPSTLPIEPMYLQSTLPTVPMFDANMSSMPFDAEIKASLKLTPPRNESKGKTDPTYPSVAGPPSSAQLYVQLPPKRHRKMFDAVPSKSALYWQTPQRTQQNYKCSPMGAHAFFVMRKYGWFKEGAWEGANEVLAVLTQHPDYEALVENLHKLLEVDF